MSHHQYHRQKNDYSIYGWVFLTVAIALLIGLSVYYFSSKDTGPSNQNQSIVSSGNKNSSNQTPSNETINGNLNEPMNNGNSNQPANENINPENQNISGEVVRSNIMVRYPEEGSVVGLPLKIQGEGREFESVVHYRVKNAKGVVLADGPTMTNAPDVGRFGQFLISLPLDLTKTTSVVVEVFANSPKDGAEVDKVTRTVTIDPSLRSLEIYFGNTLSDPKAECETVVSAIRSIPKVEKIGTAALQGMLGGPSDQEKASGFVTNIPETTKLKTFTIEGTEGRPDFTAELDKGVAGSCRVQAIRAQIEKTLKQFSTIQSVNISIEGKTEGILQP